MTKAQIQTIRARRLPVYRALANMQPLSHWLDRSQPFQWEKSEVVRFICAILPDATKNEVRKIFHAAAYQFDVILFDRASLRWIGTLDTSKLRCPQHTEERYPRIAMPMGRLEGLPICGYIPPDLDDLAEAAIIGGFSAMRGVWNRRTQAYDEVPDVQARIEAFFLWSDYKDRMPLAMCLRIHAAMLNP